MITPNIHSIGIELECGVDDKGLDRITNWVKTNKLDSHLRVDDDGSVEVYDKDNGNAEIKFWHEDRAKFMEFITFAFSEDGGNIEQNSSCGNHMHIRFKDNERAMAIMCYEPVWNEFIDKYTRYANTKRKYAKKYLNRLRCSYCRSNYNEDLIYNQISSSADRYTMFNFNAIHRYNTIEVRLMPYFKGVLEAKQSVKWLIDTLNTMYRANARTMLKGDSRQISKDTTTIAEEILIPVDIGRIRGRKIEVITSV